MKKKMLKLDIELWFSNRLVRLCSVAARGFLIDMKMLSHPSGYLISNDAPLSDEQLSILTGISVTKVREYIKELAEAKAFQVDENGLFFPDMVADAKFKADAKAYGIAGQEKKKAKVKIQEEQISEPLVFQTMPKQPSVAPPEMVQQPQAISSTSPVKKVAPWYSTPAGWIREGQKQGVSKGQDEDMDSFKERVAKRLPDGAHLDHVTPYVAKQIRSEIEKYVAKDK